MATAMGVLHLTREPNLVAVTTPMPVASPVTKRAITAKPAKHADKDKQDQIKALAVKEAEEWRDELEGYTQSQASARKLARTLADEMDFLSCMVAKKLELDQLPCSGPMVLDTSDEWTIPVAAIADVNFDFFNDNSATLKYFKP